MKELVRLAWEALFLSEVPYAEMRDDSNPVLRGLGIILMVAVAVALVGLVGTALEWATSPKMDDIQQAILMGFQQMDWFQELQNDPMARDEFQKYWELGWSIGETAGAPNIGSAALNIVLLPLGLVFVWFLYGVFGHLFARLLGGEGTIGQALGCTALAVAPQLLNLVTLFPYVIVGGVVGTWTLLCRYVALKTSHRLNWSRALTATLLPYVAYYVVLSFFICLATAIAGTIAGGMTR